MPEHDSISPDMLRPFALRVPARRRLVCCLLAPSLGAALCHARASDSTVDTAIRKVIARYLEARNHADEAATRAVLTVDADQLVSTGEWRRGRDSLVRGAMASSRKEAGNSRIRIDAVRVIAADVAIADGDYETSSYQTSRKMRTTFVMKREDGEWKISAIRNMLPSPPSP